MMVVLALAAAVVLEEGAFSLVEGAAGAAKPKRALEAAPRWGRVEARGWRSVFCVELVGWKGRWMDGCCGCVGRSHPTPSVRSIDNTHPLHPLAAADGARCVLRCCC